MVQEIQRKHLNLVYLEQGDLHITNMKCPNCGTSISVKSSDNWVSTKCKCQCALIYPDSYLEGRLDVITLERHKLKVKNNGRDSEKEL